MRTFPLLLLLLLVPLAAQPLVSPQYCTSFEGVYGYSEPLDGLYRYQQIHTDLGTQPRTVRGLALRRDAQAAANQDATLRVLQAEIRLAHAAATLSTTFANNYATTPVVVWPRGGIGLPDWRALPPSMPSPFDAVLPFALPFAFSGQGNLLWEIDISVHSAAGKAYPTDGVARAIAQPGAYRMLGDGCTTANGKFEHRGLLQSQTVGPGMFLNLSWNAERGPSNAAGVLWIGVSDPNVLVPGLCGSGRLRSDALVGLPAATDAAGAFASPALRVVYQAVFEGASLYSQVVCLDATQPGLKVAATNGLAATAPFLPGAHGSGLVPVHRLVGAGSGASTGTLFTSSGLVAEIR
jgi:hypothetical protein